MKIISKYKDYYDYLSGVWGEDPKLVLDRREFDIIKYRFEGSKTEYFTLLICGNRIDGIYKNGNFYYGEKISEICPNKGEKPSKRKWYYWMTPLPYDSIYYTFEWKEYRRYRDINVLGEIVEDRLKLNKKYNCPILITNSGLLENKDDDLLEFPILQDLNLGSYISSETIYKWLSDWFAQIENEKEVERGITITNTDKILSKGFDPKTSFRPKMK